MISRMTVVDLPEDVVIEILERLPTKSLMRFKSVERSWNSIFKSNTFVRRQSQRQRGSNEGSFMIFDTCMLSRMKRIKLVSCNDQPIPLQLQDLEYPFPYPIYYAKTIRSYGHCNGVFCLGGSWICCDKGHRIDETILWNPATKEVKVIENYVWTDHGVFWTGEAPPSPYVNLARSTDFVSSCGFGAADPDTFHDFKFIKFYLKKIPDVVAVVVYAEVYNSNTNSWTLIHGIDPNDFIGPAGPILGYDAFPNDPVYANGVCHWLSAEYTFILCFDFRCNKFHKLNTPSTLPNSRILEARDSIAYVVAHQIWILKQDRSWTIVCNIELLRPIVNIYAIWKDDAEFLVGSAYDKLTSYNSHAQPLQQFQFFPEHAVRVHKYVESIAPLSLNKDPLRPPASGVFTVVIPCYFWFWS